MSHHRTGFRGLAGLRFTILIASSILLITFHHQLRAQEIQREQPVWWFGGAGAVNLNFYGGTTQILNLTLTTPTAFHSGFGAGIYFAPHIEYRPDPMWGGMLQIGYDDRRGSFYDVTAPCGQNSTLSATPSYLSIEPSVRFAPFSDEFFVYIGPRIGYNWSPFPEDEKSFLFTVKDKFTSQDQFSGMNSFVYSGQIGLGYDVALTSPNEETQWELSPFVSYQPIFGQDPRSTGNWGISTVRVGVALKFGSGDVIPQKARAVIPAVVERDIQFSVRAPKVVPEKRRVRETFPLRNAVYFDKGSTEIPNRYEMLTKAQAINFKEEQLQEVQPKNNTGRSLRQMTVYYNVLNIVGDRMKRSPSTTISLSGSSEQGLESGTKRANAVKKYLVTVFGIDSSRITTHGRLKPLMPSMIPGSTMDIELLKEGDRRVDIESTSPEIMIQVGGGPHYMLKPVQIVAVVQDPLDSYVLFNADGANEVFASWSIVVTDRQGNVQHFGPSTKDQITVSGNKILGDRQEGDYDIVMLAQTKSGKSVRKESSVHLIRRTDPIKESVRFSILFDFDQSKTIASYEKFLTDVVTPLIPDRGIVVIHGYTDNIGEDSYNETLSNERVQETRKIIERAITAGKKKGITFETFGFGENAQHSPFDNFFPEQRSYNRSVIIDIVPD